MQILFIAKFIQYSHTIYHGYICKPFIKPFKNGYSVKMVSKVSIFEIRKCFFVKLFEISQKSRKMCHENASTFVEQFFEKFAHENKQNR